MMTYTLEDGANLKRSKCFHNLIRSWILHAMTQW